jgi:hypothetical protein
LTSCGGFLPIEMASIRIDGSCFQDSANRAGHA